MIFDMIHKPDFDNQERSSEILSERLRKLRAWQGGRNTNARHITLYRTICYNR